MKQFKAKAARAEYRDASSDNRWLCNRGAAHALDKERPKARIDDEVGFNIAGSSPRASDTSLKPAVIESVVFHELAEAYAKVEHNKQYADAHQEAIQREQKLHNERPYLRDHNPGSGPGDRVIIKK
jgi:hypothetical protein